MRATICGGVNEYGRVCFLIESGEVSFLLDCGIMKGKPSDGLRYPQLTPEICERLSYVFLTHAHEDHWGALEWIVKMGFIGEVIASSHTIREILRKARGKVWPNTVTFSLLEAREQNNEILIGSGVRVKFGASGHVLGSVWYTIDSDGRTIFYSGDYSAESILHAPEPPPVQRYDLAILDNAYGTTFQTQRKQLNRITRQVEAAFAKGSTVLFPVPSYGRGLDLFTYFSKKYADMSIPIYLEETIYSELLYTLSNVRSLSRRGKSHGRKALSNTNVEIFRTDGPGYDRVITKRPCIIVVPGGMMESSASQTIYSQLLKDDTVILTGNQASGTFGHDLLLQQGGNQLPEAVEIRYNVHQGVPQLADFINMYQPERVVLFHSKVEETSRSIGQLRAQGCQGIWVANVGDTISL